MMRGFLIAGLSMISAKPGCGSCSPAIGIIAAIAALTLSGFLTTWLARGQNTDQLTNLTGRTAVWAAVEQHRRATSSR